MMFFDDKIADRLGGANFGKSTEIYKFELIKRAKADARKAHPETRLLDLGVGEPDWAADPIVVQKLAEEAGKPENRWYSDNGIPEFQEAAAGYLHRVFGVADLNAAENIVHGIGSKPVLALLPLCFINSGDILLTTIPGYPVSGTYTRYLGGEVFNVPLRESNGFLPDLRAIPPSVLKRAKAFYLNYPNNPTGAVATREFFSDLVGFAAENNIVIIHDAAYAALTYDGTTPLSFLSVDGALDVGVEVHSLSKPFNMTGWRIAFVCGNPKAVKAYATVKDNTDSGQFRAIQKAAIVALAHLEITDRTVKKYSRRFDLLVKTLNELGFAATKPKGSFYCYVRAAIGTEAGVEFKTAAACSDFLMRNALISTVPWDDVGSFIRFSVTFEAGSPAEEIAVMEELKRRVGALRLRF
jgi:LL-diaminopimelate aminotransferase